MEVRLGGDSDGIVAAQQSGHQPGVEAGGRVFVGDSVRVEACKRPPTIGLSIGFCAGRGMEAYPAAYLVKMESGPLGSCHGDMGAKSQYRTASSPRDIRHEISVHNVFRMV